MLWWKEVKILQGVRNQTAGTVTLGLQRACTLGGKDLRGNEVLKRWADLGQGQKRTRNVPQEYQAVVHSVKWRDEP